MSKGGVNAAAGAMLGKAFVEMGARMKTAHLEQATPHMVDTFIKAQELLHERAEQELVPTTRALLGRLAADESVPVEVRRIFADMAEPEHPVGGAVLTTFVGTLLGFGLAPILAPFATKLAREMWEKVPSQPLSVAEVALALVKGRIGKDEAELEALQTGYDPAAFSILTDITGEPPGVQELLFAYRRGDIDEARLEHGIRQSRVKNEWIDVIKALRHVPMSIAQAVAAAVEGHLSLDEAARITEQNGLNPDHFMPLYETAGRPPGPAQIGELMNRGFISRDEAVQAIRESDVKNKYIDAILRTAIYLPPVRTVVAMLRHGAITDEHGARLLAENGVRPEDAAGYMAEAHATKTEKVRDLTVAQITKLYADRAIDQELATEMLESLGYDDHEAAWIIELVDLDFEIKLRSQATQVIRARYLARKIDVNDASSALDRIGIPTRARDQYLETWGLELELSPRILTAGEIERLTKHGLLTPEEGVQRMRALGYSEGDAIALISLYAPAS